MSVFQEPNNTPVSRAILINKTGAVVRWPPRWVRVKSGDRGTYHELTMEAVRRENPLRVRADLYWQRRRVS